MPDSQNPEHVQKLIREFQLKGQNLIPTVTGEIVPTIQIADLSTETRADDRLAALGQIGAASGAGNQNVIVLANPAGSGVVGFIDRITVHQPNADFFAISIEPTTGTGASGFWRDTRELGAPKCQTFALTPVAAVLDPLQFVLLAATEFVLELGIILLPARWIEIRQLNQNETLHVNFFFRERDLLAGE